LARPNDKASEWIERNAVALLQRSFDFVEDQIKYFTGPAPGELGFFGDGVNHIGFRQRRISYSGEYTKRRGRFLPLHGR
jgi:hypothetical protein